MKKTKRFWILLITSQLSVNCGLNNNKGIKNTESNTGQDFTKGNQFAWIPQGTNIQRKGSALHVKAPNGWSYIGYNRNGNITNGQTPFTTSLSCPCDAFQPRKVNNGSEAFGQVITCSGNNCTIQHQLQLKDLDIPISRGGYFQPDAGIWILKPGDQAPAAFDALLFELPTFKEQLMRFLAKAYEGVSMALPVKNQDGSITAPPGYSLAAITLMGRGMLTVIPEDVARSQPGYRQMAKAQCECAGAKCSLKLHAILGTGIIWCNENCNGICTLTLNHEANANDNVPQPIKITSYTF